jgi:hypothetical protein
MTSTASGAGPGQIVAGRLLEEAVDSGQMLGMDRVTEVCRRMLVASGFRGPASS